MITPELPRAPISAPNAAAERDALRGHRRPERLGLDEGRADRRHHVRAGVAVGHREDVEGVDLVDRGLERGCRGTEGARGARRRRRIGGPSGATRHQAGLGIRRRPSRSRPCPTGQRRPAAGGCGGSPPGCSSSRGDADRELVDLPPERGPDRVADRQIDLARDLGDRQPVGDAQAHPDRQLPPATDTRSPPGRRSIQPRRRSIQPPAKPATPYDPSATPRTMSITARRVTSARPAMPWSGKAPPRNRAWRAGPGSARGAWYSTAPFGPDRP